MNESDETGLAQAEARATRKRGRGRPKGSKNKPKATKKVDVITITLTYVFEEAAGMQGCRAPYEMDKAREAIEDYFIALRDALRELPAQARATLERRFADITRVRDEMLEALEADYNDRCDAAGEQLGG